MRSGFPKILAVVILALGLPLAWFVLRQPEIERVSSARLAPDLAEHEIYRTYDLGGGDKVIHFAAQPLFLPPALMTEVMARDAELHRGLAALGYTIRFHSYLKGADINYFLFQGELDGAVGGNMPAISAAAKNDVVIAALVDQYFATIVAGGIDLVEDLRGKRIAYGFGSQAHYSLLRSLTAAGLTEDDVHLVRMDVTRMPEALRRGDIDAFCAWEPTPTMALTADPDLVPLSRDINAGYMYFRSEFSDRHPEAVRLILASLVRALTWMTSRDDNLLRAARWARDAGQELSGAESNLSPEQYARLGKESLRSIASLPMFASSDTTAAGRIFEAFNFLQGIGSVPDSVAWSRVRDSFLPGPLEEVLRKPVRYRLDEYTPLPREMP